MPEIVKHVRCRIRCNCKLWCGSLGLKDHQAASLSLWPFHFMKTPSNRWLTQHNESRYYCEKTLFLFDEGYYTQESRLATLSGLWKCTRVNAALTTVHILILVRFTYWQGLHGQIWWEYLQKFIYSMTVTRIWKESPVISMRLDWGTIN